MQSRRIPVPVYLAIQGMLLAANAVAADPPMPATMEEMWKIIQQQQKEIEALKAAARPPETGGTARTVAETPHPPTPPQVDAARKTNILAAEVEKLKTQLLIPETREYKSQYGLGPAASQVYRVNRGLSIGGYGEAFYSHYTGDKGTTRNSADLQRAVLYVGYKFNDKIILNNEFEFEHATTGEGSEERGEASVEFSQLDFLLHSAANIRAGLMLTPMGFINEMHEPTTFHGNRRPDVERYIIPSTWRELGAGLFGQVMPGLQYRLYAMNGLNANGFASSGIQEGRQEGSQALAEDIAFTGRLDYTPAFMPGLMVGGSAYLGNAGQQNRYQGVKADILTQLYEGHVQWHYKGWELRALGAVGQIGNAALLSAARGEAIGRQNYGWYTEAAYDLMPLLWRDSSHYLAPFFRFERYDTLADVAPGWADDGTYDRWIYQGGLTYKPITNISIKADYRNVQSARGKLPDEFNLGLGFIF